MRPTFWKKLFAGAIVTFAILLIALVSSQHRIRLIAGSFEAVDSCAHLDSAHPLRFLIRTPLWHAPAFSVAVATLCSFDKTYPLLSEDALPTLDQPDTCVRRLEAGHPLHCYNVDIAVAVVLSKLDIPSRLWDWNGPAELGGDGHNLLEIFDGISHGWKAIDPYYHCYFILGNDSTPLSATKLRRTLLTGAGGVHLVRYSDRAGNRPDSNILAELKYLAPGAMLQANNDFAWRYAHRYGWLTPIAAPLFDALPLRTARGIRTVILGFQDRLHVIEDRFSPHFPFVATKVAFWTLIALFIFSWIGIMFVLISEKRRKLVS